MPSEAHQRFVRSFDGPIVGRAGLEDFDLAALAQLPADERADAEKRLLARLDKKVDDPRVPRALASLRSPAALDAIRATVTGFYPSHTRVAAAQALWELERAAAAVDALSDTLRRSFESDVRVAAAQALAPHPGKPVDDALLDAWSTEADATSRQALYAALLARHGLDGLSAAPSPLATLSIRAGSPAQAIRDEAVLELRALLAALAAGRSKAELGLGVAPKNPAMLERVRLSVIADPRAPGGWQDVDIDALIALEGHDRAWAESFLLMRLAKLDPRLPAALAWIGARRAVAPLQELSTQGDAAWQKACRDALDALRS